MSSANSGKLVLLWIFPALGVSSYVSSNVSTELGLILGLCHVWAALVAARSGSRTGVPLSSSRLASLLGVVLVLLFLVARIRTFLHDPGLFPATDLLYTIALYTCALLLARAWAQREDSACFAPTVMKSYLVFFLLNFLLWASGISDAAGEATVIGELEPLFSFLPARQMLPLGSMGISGSAMSALLAAVCSVVLLKGGGEGEAAVTSGARLLYIAGCVAGVTFIFLAGNRLPLLIFVSVCAFYFLKLYRRMVATISISLVLYLFPLLYLPVLLPLCEIGLPEWMNLFSRTGNPMDILLINNRVIIWTIEFFHLLNDAELYDLLFGYGYYGQTISGIVYDYEPIFQTSYKFSETISVHNSLLQVIINSGLFGAVIFILAIVFTLRRVYAHWESDAAAAATTVIVTMIGTAMIEAQLATDTPTLLLFLLLAVFYLSPAKSEADEAPVVAIAEGTT